MIKYAPRVYETLSGIFCVYKPRDISPYNVTHTIQTKLAAELNALPCRPPRKIVEIHEENLGTDLPVVTTVPDIADDPLVVGPRYIGTDFYVDGISHLKKSASGVTVYGLGHFSHKLREILRANFIKVYHVQGQFGMATQDFTPEGHMIEKTTWHHITQSKLDRVIAALQAGHQKHMFYYAGVDLQSQEAYELASQGLVRPAFSPGKEIPPLVYSIKCVNFDPPNFALEIHTINENDGYLKKIIHEIGLELRSSAVCTQVRRTRYGPFTLSHALLNKHWTSDNIISNIKVCRELVTPDKLKPPKSIKPSERTLTKLPPGDSDEKLLLEGL